MKQFSLQHHKKLSVVVLFVLALWLAGCEKNTTSPPDQELELTPAANQGLVGAWTTTHSLQSATEVTGIVKENFFNGKEDVEGISSPQQLISEYRKMKTGMSVALSGNSFGRGMLGDSLLWFIDWTDSITGFSVRKALYYNSGTGYARYYEAIYRFPPQLQLEYDSTEIRVDLNFTLHNPADDRLLSLFKYSRFKSDFSVDSTQSVAQVTDYGPNNEVTGAVLDNQVWYGQQSQLELLTQNMELNPDESGHISQRLDYRDGTFMQRTVNFYADYTGDFSEVWRDGTTVNGTFDRLEDDNHAAFTKTVNFPTGHDPVKIHQAAEVTLNPADSSTALMLNEKIYFANGGLDTSQFNFEEFYEAGLKKTHLEGWNSDGSHADLLVTHYPEYKEVDGTYTAPDGYFMLIQAIFYNDGSGELTLKVYENEQAYQNGEPPVAIITIHFNPDGSGSGELAQGEDRYRVQVNPGGKMTVTDQKGRSSSVNGY